MFTFTRRLLLILGLVFCLVAGYSQPITVATQNFDGGGSQTTFTATPSGSWVNDATYYSSGSNSIHADIPSLFGGITYYTSDVIDISSVAYPPNGLEYVKLRFKQICKVSPLDTVKVQYKLDVPGAAWIDLPSSAYEGTAVNYGTSGFNAGSYSIWNAEDSLVNPDNSWWKEEVFDLSDDVGYERFQIRFYLKRGNTLSTDVSYGWNIDDFSVKANSIAMITPTLEWSGSIPHDTIYSTGPYLIKAVIASNTSAPLHPIYLKWTHTYNNVSATDSVLMTNTTGNIYEATIPQYVVGTQVTYSITAMDTGYNEKTISESYVINRLTGGAGVTGYVYVGNGVTTSYQIPINMFYCYSWTKNLYLGTELQQSAAGGQITRLAWEWGYSTSYTYTNQTCYFKAVPDVSIASNAYVDPLLNGATQVWHGQFTTPNIPGTWMEITLDQPFILPPGMNLMIFWHHEHGTYPGTAYVWRTHTTPQNMVAHYYTDVYANFPNNGYLTTTRANLRLWMNGPVNEYHSAGLESLILPDTVTSCSIPIVVNVKNKGFVDLTSATLYYSIDGGAPVSKAWTGFLPWDFESLDTLDYISMPLNAFTTIKTWISMPNNVADTTNWDDTLSKTVYRMSDISLQLIEPPTDTVYSTGPYSITAQVSSRTGSPIINPVYLYLEITDSLSNISYDTIVMVSQGGNIWWGEIPNLPYESDVVYTVSVNDNCNTALESGGHYYIKYMGCTSGGASVGIPINFSYTGSAQSRMFPTGIYKLEVWGAQGGNGQNGTIPNAGLGGYSSGELTLGTNTLLNIYVGGQGSIGQDAAPSTAAGGYNGGGSATNNTDTDDGGAGGGASDIRIGSTSLYARVIVAGGGGGGQYYNAGVPYGHGGGTSGVTNNASYGTGGTQTGPGTQTYGTSTGTGFGQGANNAGTDGVGGGGGWYGGGPSCGGSGYVYTSATATNYPAGCLLNGSYYLANAQTIAGNTAFPAVAGGTETGHSGNGYVRITPLMLITSCLDNSVSMDAFVSPKSSVDNNSLIPVTVRIRNKGVLPLYSCDINWTLGGVSQPSVSYNNITGLPYDFTDTITLGYFTSGALASNYDIIAWVDSPNGQYDSTAMDDTLAISTIACGTMSSLTIGSSPAADFATINAAMAALSICGMHGLVTLNVEDGTYTDQINLSSLRNIMSTTDTLIIQSLNGIASGVIVNAGNSSAAVMNGNSNIYIKNITLTSTSAHGVEFTGYCNNIEINSCIINANPTATSTTSCGIYYGNSASSAMGSLRVLNNTINGGYAGIYLSYWHKTSNERNATTKYVTIVNNTIENWYYSGIYSNYYISYDTIGYNTIVSRTVASTQYGIYLYYYNWAKYVIGNKINLCGNNSSYSQYGIYPYYYFNDGTAVAGLIANNEIRKLGNSSSFYGGYHTYSKAMWINNTIYAAGSSTYHYGMYIAYASSTYPLTFKNNIVSITGSGTNYAIYTGTATYASAASVINYNDYYVAGNYIAYIGGTINNSIVDMRTATTQDANSVSVLPAFTDPNIDLSLIHGANVLCPRDATVMRDINRTSRNTTTAMGCYQPAVYNGNGALVEIVGINQGFFNGQTDTISVRIMNTGNTTLTSVNLGWSHNGTVVNASANFNINLVFGQDTVIRLGTFVYTSDRNDFVIWINNVNNGTLVDQNINDDTIKTHTWICTSPYSGTLTVGNGGLFSDLDIALTALNTCGVNGNVVLSLMSGYVYNGSIDLRNNNTVFGNNKLTITSAAGNYTSATISGDILISNTNNVELNAITIGNYSYNSGSVVAFSGSASNITIANCRILMDTTSISTTTRGIDKRTTGIANNIVIKNNIIEGGYAGIWFCAGTGTSSYGENITIDSNTITNFAYIGISLLYSKAKSVSYNTLHGRDTNHLPNTTLFCLDFEFSNIEKIIGNHVYHRNPNILQTQGITDYYCNYYLNTNNNVTLYANNEIVVKSNAFATAVWSSYSTSKYINNSFYVDGTGIVEGMELDLSSGRNIELVNNNIVARGSDSTCVAIGLQPSVGSTPANLVCAYNNYYSDAYLFYNGDGNWTSSELHVNMSDWTALMPSDVNSVQILPAFIDVEQSLELSTYPTQLEAPVYSGIQWDIKGLLRQNPTTMGAYSKPLQGKDVMLVEITPWASNTVVNKTVNVNVEIMNAGAVALNSVTLGWSINGVLQPDVTIPCSPALTSMNKTNLFVGSFVVGSTDASFDVKVWAVGDSIVWNDTVSANTIVVPMVEWVEPQIGDTTNSLSFDISVHIETVSGAPTSAPVMYIHTTGRCIDEYDTIPMIQSGDNWIANIPKQYYNTNVVYEVTIADTVGNIITLIDSTYLLFELVDAPEGFGTYTGDVQIVTLPKGTYKLEVWGAQGSNNASLNTGGKGGYSVGEITLPSRTTLYVYVGGQGSALASVISPGGFNGGGSGGSYPNFLVGGGGGASDIRIGDTSLYARVIVAGGGGGAGCNYGTASTMEPGGAGGGLSGIAGLTGSYPAYGGTQTSGGAGAAQAGSFGQGGNQIAAQTGGGGGGGWYGGGASSWEGGGGGSGYVYTSSTAANYPAGCLLNSSYYLSNAQTIAGNQSFLSPLGVSETGHSGDGYVRITKLPSGKVIEGGITNELYSSTNLAITKLLSPVDAGEFCLADSLPVQIQLFNLGETDYDFAVDSIIVKYEINSPAGVSYSGAITLNTEELLSGESVDVELMPALYLPQGIHQIKAWVVSSIDNFACDDTLTANYESLKLSLPFDENFSNGIPNELRNLSVIGNTQWVAVSQGSGADTNVVPVYGNQMIAFGGNRSSMAQLSTIQIDIANANQPKLTLWYYQDTGNAKDYTNIFISTDGGVSFTHLLALQRGDPSMVLPEWRDYTIDLSPYQGGSCTHLMFESMVKSDNGVQYIDRIRLDAKQDVAIGAILMDSLSACNINAGTISVVLDNRTSQGINYALYPTALHVTISGAINQTITIPLTTGILAGMEKDTIDIWTGISFVSGNYQITAFIESIDELLTNDTITMSFTVDPKLLVRGFNNTSSVSTILPGTELLQDVTIYNTGNMDMEDIEVTLEITTNNVEQTVKDTISGVLLAGDSIAYTMTKTYTVPKSSTYSVFVTVNPLCNSNINATYNVSEFADMDDIELLSIEQPLSWAVDTFGRSQNIVVKLRNNNPDNDATGVKLHAEVIANGSVIFTDAGTINSIVAGSTVNHSFTNSYTVPREISYTLKVYVESQDRVFTNDTLLVNRTATDTLENNDVPTLGDDNIYLGQNTPNPARKTTKVEYRLPHDGKAVFNIYTVTGQVIYTQRVDATVGKNNIIFDIDNLSSGIYFYSMEFEGQKLVKKMSVK